MFEVPMTIATREQLTRSQGFIDGKWIGEPKLDIQDPATGDVVGRVPDLGGEGARLAVEAAERAFRPWAARSGKERGDLLRKWFDAIMAHQTLLAEIMTAEQGKPLAEAKGEIAYAASFVEFFAEEARRVHGEIIPANKPGSRILVMRQPIGVMAAITPWNFPAAMITRKIAPALAAGCTVVVKPAPETPLTALALVALAEMVGFPSGAINIVTGDAVSIGGVLTSHPAVRLVSFTGSTPVGKLLARQAAETVKRVALELGGNAPFIVFDDADIEAAAEGLILAKFRNAGQTCVCPNRVFVAEGIHDAFVEALAKRVAQLKVGRGAEDGVQIGPLINARALEKVEAHIEDARKSGACIVTGGRKHALGGTFYEPTVLTGAASNMRLAQEETFGPVAAIFRFSSEAEAISLANATASGLAGYFYSRDIDRVMRVAEALEVGMIGVNTGLISSEVIPFGGIKESGLGREGSRHGIDEFVEFKAIVIGEGPRKS
jgi:succinate-semialdehyde dehydrogenase / glutarate-semialdehyde dehydrogenase